MEEKRVVEDTTFTKAQLVDERDQDDTAKFIESDGDVFEYSQKEAAIVRWKLDLILLPMVFVSPDFREREGLTLNSPADVDNVPALLHGQSGTRRSVHFWHHEGRCE